MSERMPALFAAKAVAMSARCEGLSMHAVDDMRTKAEELLARDDPLRSAVLSFATMFDLHRHDAYALKKLGEELDREIDAALDLSPRRAAFRRDIDG